MGSLFILNDFEQDIYWKKNIFIIENFIILESLVLFILSFISLLVYPFELFKLLRQNNPMISIKKIVFIIIVFSLFSTLLSLLIKYIHKANKIKPIYILCLIKIICYIVIISLFICLVSSFYIHLLIIKWINFTGIKVLKSISSGNKDSTYIRRELFIFLLNNIINLCSIFGLYDCFTEIIIILKASKFLCQGNNINNQNLLNELLKMPKLKNENKTLENSLSNNLNIIESKDNIIKLRFIMDPNNNKRNIFPNENNSFEEVQIMQKIEYNSIGTQTEEIKNKQLIIM